jgi:hypothetical protein
MTCRVGFRISQPNFKALQGHHVAAVRDVLLGVDSVEQIGSALTVPQRKSGEGEGVENDALRRDSDQREDLNSGKVVGNMARRIPLHSSLVRMPKNFVSTVS